MFDCMSWGGGEVVGAEECCVKVSELSWDLHAHVLGGLDGSWVQEGKAVQCATTVVGRDLLVVFSRTCSLAMWVNWVAGIG